MKRPATAASWLLLALIAPVALAADPPFDGGIGRGSPARTGDLGALKLPEKGEVLWQIDIDNGAGGPVVADGVVYLTGGQTSLFAIKADGSTVLWQEDHPGRFAYASPLVVGDRLYIASSLGLAAHARADGKEIWNYPIAGGAASSSPVLAGGKVIAGGSDGSVHAVDPATGAAGWKHDIARDAPPLLPIGDAKLNTGLDPDRPMSPTSDGATLFLPTLGRSRIVAIDAATGRRRWAFQAKGWTYAAPSVAGDDLLVTSHDKNLYCLDKATGKPRWEFATDGPITAGAAVRDGSAYLGSGDGIFYRVDLKTGKKVWSFETPKAADGSPFTIASSPLIDADSVCFGSFDGFVYALNVATGALRWKVKSVAGSEVHSTPTTDGRFVYISVRPDAVRQTGTSSVVAIGLPPK